MGHAFPMLQCLMEYETAQFLPEFHQRACDNHISGKPLAHKLLRTSYYCLTLLKDNVAFVNKFDQFQIHYNLHHTPLSSFTHDITLTFLPVGWIFWSISSRVKAAKFFNRMGQLLHEVDRGGGHRQAYNRKSLSLLLAQFSSTLITNFCRESTVQINLIFFIYPRANGQVESTNKVILKRKKEVG